MDDILFGEIVVDAKKEKTPPPKSLTEDQQKKILVAWQNAKEDKDYTLKNFVVAAFGGNGEEFDYRSTEARLVREFLASKSLKFLGAKEYIKKTKITLTPEQKTYVLNNHEQYTPVEMARTIFNDPSISNLHMQTTAVKDELQVLKKAGKFVKPPPDTKISFKYSPPTSVVQTLARVREAVENLEYPEKADQLTTKQREELNYLMGFLRSFAFLSKIEAYEDEVERRIFELNIIRYVYNKPDLTPEEFDQYLTLADQRIIEGNIKKNMKALQGMIDREIDGEDEDPNLKLSVVEALSSKQKELDECIKRQETIRKSLVGTRKDRFDQKIQINQSIVQLVEAMKEQERRDLMVKHAELRKSRLKEEIDRLESLDELSVQIFGISKDEIINGL